MASSTPAETLDLGEKQIAAVNATMVSYAHEQLSKCGVRKPPTFYRKLMVLKMLQVA